MRAILMSLALLALGACDAPALERDCAADEGGGVIEGQVVTDQVPGVVGEDLTVRGVAADTEGRTIRRVVVAGIAAKNDGFNFDQWSALVPIGVLRNLPGVNGATDTHVNIEVFAFDGCDEEFALDSFIVDIDRTPGVDRLSMTVDLPGVGVNEATFLPASGEVAAAIRITSSPEARGSDVTMSSNTGTFAGVDAENQVTLAGDGTADAQAIVLFTPGPDDAIVNATAGSLSAAPQLIEVAGAPTLAPSSATLGPGNSVTVAVLSEIDGQVRSCLATPAAGVTVAFASGSDAFTVTADPTLTAIAMTTVTCRDRYGQTATGTYSAQP